ncbi:MAG TPA: hypothetical protein VN843_08345 [Anaerolineales bacterium]|nr:hypothetical protein [Anaerolineales bacterium]
MSKDYVITEYAITTPINGMTIPMSCDEIAAHRLANALAEEINAVAFVHEMVGDVIAKPCVYRALPYPSLLEGLL